MSMVAAVLEHSEGKKLRLKKALPKKNNIIDLPLPTPSRVADESFELEEAVGEELIIKYRAKARKLGRSILRRWHARLDIQEVDSIVDLSLCEASARFNPTKGASFVTFLYYHLRGHLIRAVAAAASLNTVPFSSCDALKNYGNADSEVRASTAGGSANAIEIAEALISQESLLREETLWKKEMIRMSSEACAKLDPLEREIIERLYLQEQQLLDIAHFLGYSRCHVSRVKKKALRTLQADLCKELDIEAKPLSEEEESESFRRKVHRRRPRSKVYGNKVHRLPKAA